MPSPGTYTDQRPPEDRYPHRIIAPPRASACCFSEMADVGPPETEARGAYQDRRCRQCGCAVRVILREIPDAALVASLRKALARAFLRHVPA